MPRVENDDYILIITNQKSERGGDYGSQIAVLSVMREYESAAVQTVP